MVIFDRRDEFQDSDSNLPTIAAEAHDLYESEEFHEDVLDALSPVLCQYLDCEAVDQAAEDVLAEWLLKDGKGGLFQLRNQIVTNREADLQEGDVIRMESAMDSENIITYVVHQADRDATGVRVWRVEADSDGEFRATDHAAGHVLYDDRFEVDRQYRDRDERPIRTARELAAELQEVAA